MSNAYRPPSAELADRSEYVGSPIIAVFVGFLIAWVGGVGAATAVTHGYLSISLSQGSAFEGSLRSGALFLSLLLLSDALVAWLAAYSTARIANRREYLWVTVLLVLNYSLNELIVLLLPVMNDGWPTWYLWTDFAVSITASYFAAYVSKAGRISYGN